MPRSPCTRRLAAGSRRARGKGRAASGFRELRSPRADGISRSARGPPRDSRTRGTCLRRNSRGSSREQRATRGCWATRSRRDRQGGRRAASPPAPRSPPCASSGVNAEQVTTRSAKSSASGKSSKKPSITRTRPPCMVRESFSRSSWRRGAAGSIAQTARARSMQLDRQASGARTDLNDPLDAFGQPRHQVAVEPLRADEPVVEPRLAAGREAPRQALRRSAGPHRHTETCASRLR